MYPGYVFGVDTPYRATLSTNKQELEVSERAQSANTNDPHQFIVHLL